MLTCINGYFVAIEVKGDKGKPSELQLYNIRKIIESGGIGLILYPNQFDDFKSICEHLQNNYEGAAIEIMNKNKINGRR